MGALFLPSPPLIHCQESLYRVLLARSYHISLLLGTFSERTISVQGRDEAFKVAPRPFMVLFHLMPSSWPYPSPTHGTLLLLGHTRDMPPLIFALAACLWSCDLHQVTSPHTLSSRPCISGASLSNKEPLSQVHTALPHPLCPPAFSTHMSLAI